MKIITRQKKYNLDHTQEKVTVKETDVWMWYSTFYLLHQLSEL